MTTITALPTAPNRADPSTFDTRADAFVAALPTLVTEINTVSGEVNTNATTATTQAGLATSNGAAQVALAAAQVVLATDQADNAAISASAAAGSALVAGAVVWVSGTTYALGDCRYSPIDMQTYRRRVAGAGATDPSLDSTNWAKALAGGVSQVTTATTATTLTSTPTLLKITPASYGVTVTLPDATTCSVGGPLHIIDNRGAYPVRVCDSTGVLKGFIFAGVVSHISLDDNSTAAGVWAIENGELVGASAQLLTTNMALIDAVIDIGSSQEVIIGRGVSSANCYGVVYNRATNTFGSVTLIRTGTFNSNLIVAVLSGANQVLVCSATNATTALEAVTLSISGTTITVNTAATATLSAGTLQWADGCGLIAVGSSFVTSYTVATPAAQIRALSISGTTVTIGAASVLSGTTYGITAASGSVVIAASSATTNAYVTPYTVSGSTLTLGTGATIAAGYTVAAGFGFKFFALGTRWCLLYSDQAQVANIGGSVLSLSVTTITASTVSVGITDALADAIVVGSNKVLCVGIKTSSNANILTDTAGTASAGTAITLSSASGRMCAYVSGTDVMVSEDSGGFHVVDCSGASPVRSNKGQIPNDGTGVLMVTTGSNAVLRRTKNAVFGTAFMQGFITAVVNRTFCPRLFGKTAQQATANSGSMTAFGAYYHGKADSERWQADASTVITKLECVA